MNVKRTLQSGIIGLVGGLTSLVNSGCATSTGNALLSAGLGVVAPYQDTQQLQDLALGASVATENIAYIQGQKEAEIAGRSNVNVTVQSPQTTPKIIEDTNPRYETYAFIDTDGNGVMNGEEDQGYNFLPGQKFRSVFKAYSLPNGSELVYEITDKQNNVLLSKPPVIIAGGDIKYGTTIVPTEEMSGKVYLMKWKVNDEVEAEHRFIVLEKIASGE